MLHQRLKRRIEAFIKTGPSTAENTFPVYFPYNSGARSFILPKLSRHGREGLTRPVPPRDQWISDKYGNTAEEYLASGQRDLRDMEDILTRAGIARRSRKHPGIRLRRWPDDSMAGGPGSHPRDLGCRHRCRPHILVQTASRPARAL